MGFGALRLFGVLAAALVAGLALAPPAAAKPPMWEVTDADSRMILFGTIHFMRPEMEWKTASMTAALAASEEVWFEVDPARMDDPQQVQAAVPVMLDPDRPLSTVLGTDLYRRFRDVATGLSVPPAQLEMFKPLPAGLMLGGAALVRDGYSPDSGVDKSLRGMIRDAEVKEFETLAQQFRFFSDLPDPVQIAMLGTILDDMSELGHLDKIVESWAAGDIAALEDVFLQDLMTAHADVYDVFVRDRNVAWADRLAAEMAGAGSDFIAVGALHLVGPDGLPTLLAARGYTVKRLD